ncbi:MAG: hypothetical protein JNM40_18420 [Myxococcales bacterium]|nr:hypothetical protein [Myxococcales bacterium]
MKVNCGSSSRRTTISHLTALLFLMLISLATGCHTKLDQATAEATCRELGLCLEPSRLRRFVVLCDTSLLGPCSTETLAATLDIILPAATHDGGCPVEVWMLGGTSIADTRSLGEKLSPVLAETREKTRDQARERWQQETRAFFLRAAEPYFKVHPRRSVLAEALTKLSIAHAPSGTMPTELIVISDAREVSTVGGDLECTAPPTPSVWTARLHRRAILGPGTLAHTNVYWTHLNFSGASSRCPASMQQELAVRAVWSHALSAAGAQSVSFHGGPVVLRDARTEMSVAKKE